MDGRRRVVREHEFEEQLAGLIRDAEEADEFVNAAELVLAENPHVGKLVDEEARIYSLGLQPVDGRAVVLYYTFDAQAILFLYIVSFD
jgi:hypothetical protein